MKKVEKIFAIILAVALFCSVMCIGASASYTNGSTYLNIYGASGEYYSILFSDSNDYVGYDWPNNTGPVKVVQARCTLAYTYPTFDTDNIDGDFGIKTYGAICGYQGKYGLTVDGGVGANTWKDMGYTHMNPSLDDYL